jgi:molybdopterin-guanine dinucleotide biosynthesis protein A
LTSPALETENLLWLRIDSPLITKPLVNRMSCSANKTPLLLIYQSLLLAKIQSALL